MKFDLISIEIERFRSFKERTLINFEERGPGLHFLRGRNEHEPRLGANGAGKSTIWASLAWCLYGRTPDGLRGPDVKPWSGKGQTRVATTMILGGFGRLTIERTSNPNSLRLGPEACGQEAIDSLVGLSADAFFNTVLLAQGQPLFFDMPPAEKMELFSAVLDLDRWEKRSRDASTRVGDYQRDLDQIDGELIGLGSEEKRLDEMERQASERADRWEEDRQEKLKALDVDLEGLEKELEAAQTRLGEAEAKKDLVKTELDYESAQLVGFEIERTSLERALRDAKEAAKKKTCPTCGNPIKAKGRVDLGGLASRLETVSSKCGDLSKGVVKELKRQLREVEQLCDLYEEQVQDHEGNVRAVKDIRETNADQENPYKPQLRDIRKRKKEVASEFTALNEEIEVCRSRMERARYWVKGFKDVRLHVIEEVLQELELATNAMLDEVGLIGWGVRFNIEKETKKGTTKPGLFVSILSPNNSDAVRWESWSGGEAQRLRIIGSLALSDVLLNNAGVEAGFEILDEPTKSLSPEGVRDLCDQLDERATELDRQIWLTDHMAIESARFASVLTVVKDKNGSHIAQNARGSSRTAVSASGGAKVRVQRNTAHRGA